MIDLLIGFGVAWITILCCYLTTTVYCDNLGCKIKAKVRIPLIVALTTRFDKLLKKKAEKKGWTVIDDNLLSAMCFCPECSAKRKTNTSEAKTC